MTHDVPMPGTQCTPRYIFFLQSAYENFSEGHHMYVLRPQELHTAHGEEGELALTSKMGDHYVQT